SLCISTLPYTTLFRSPDQYAAGPSVGSLEDTVTGALEYAAHEIEADQHHGQQYPRNDRDPPCVEQILRSGRDDGTDRGRGRLDRSEEHTSELQSRFDT